MEPLGPHGLGKTESSRYPELYLRSQETWFLTLPAQKIQEVILGEKKSKNTKDKNNFGNYLKRTHHYITKKQTKHKRPRKMKW